MESLGKVRIVVHNSPDYEATLELRRAVLRRPLGLDFTPEQLAEEEADIHLAIFEGEEAIACLVLTPQRYSVKMRQVAVRADRRGKGLGSHLVEASESWSREHGHQKLVLHARDTAVPFYLALSYSLEGEPFEEVGIPHRAMFKNL